MKLWLRTLCGLCLSLAIQTAVAAPKSVTHVLQNDFTALCVVDTVLVAAGNNSLFTAVFDKQNQQFHPAQLSDYAGPARRIKRFGDVTVVQSYSGFLTILSSNVLPNILVLGVVPPLEPFLDFTFLNGQLFLACGFDGLRQYQLAGDGSAVLIDSTLTPVHAIEVTSGAGHVYVADDYTGLVVFEPSIGGIGAATIVAPLTDPTTSIAVRNDTVFTGSGIGGISLFRITGDSLVPLNVLPTHVSSDRIELADSLVLSISADGLGADLVSLAGHANPIAVDPSNLFLGGAAFVSGSDVLFVTPTTFGDLSLYDLGRFESGGSQPRSANPQGGAISDVAVVEDRVLLTRETSPSLSFSLTDQSTQTGSLIFPGLGGMSHVATAGGHVFFYARDDQVVYVASEQSGAIQLDTMIVLEDTSFRSIGITGLVHDSLRLLSILAATSIELYRIGPDWVISPVARLYLPEQPIDFASIDTLLAVGCAANVYLYSISVDLLLSYRATVSLPTGSGHLVRLLSDPGQPRILSVASSGGVINYDLTSPTSPLNTGILEVDGGIVEAVQGGDYLYLATSDDGVLKVHSPAGSNPAVVDSLRLLGDKLAVAGSTVVVASEHGLWAVDWSLGADVRDNGYAELPSGFRLQQNFPNPFNPETRISYELSKPGRVELTVYNLLGQPVSRLVETTQGVGIHTAVFDGREVASGVYIYRLTTPGGSDSRKMVLVK